MNSFFGHVDLCVGSATLRAPSHFLLAGAVVICYVVMMLQGAIQISEPELPVVSARLLAARLAAGKSQEQVASEIEVSVSTYRRWEWGHRPVPQKRHLHERLCKVLNMQLTDFNPY